MKRKLLFNLFFVLSLLLVSAISLISPQVVRAATITVPDDYPTIQQAVDAAAPGDTVYVKAGSYYEHVMIRKALTLQGEDRQTTIIDGSGSGTVLYIWANGVSVSGFTVRNGDLGMRINWCSNWRIENTEVHTNNAGIYFDTSSNGTVINSDIYSNNGWGIGLGGLGTYNNTIVGNRIYSNAEGLHFKSAARNNTIIENDIYDNDHGVDIPKNPTLPNYGNVLYHNNFVGNTVNALVLQDDKANTWDNGHPSGGNYWDDYTGGDLYSGPAQDQPGSDGIGDTPYVIASPFNIDHYPLVAPVPVEFFDDFESYAIGTNPTDVYEFFGVPNPYGGPTPTDLWEVGLLDANQVLQFYKPGSNWHFHFNGKVYKQKFSSISEAGVTFYRTQHSMGQGAILFDYQDDQNYNVITVLYTNKLYISQYEDNNGLTLGTLELWTDKHILDMSHRIEVQRVSDQLIATVTRLDTNEMKTLAVTATQFTGGQAGFRIYEDYTGDIYAHADDFYVRGIVPPIDTTPPDITPSVSGTLGNNGWYTSDVTASWTVTDPDSAISSTSGCDTTVITTDTAGTTLTCEATSDGGTASESVTIKRDATAPAITVVTPQLYDVQPVGTPLDFTASDPLSGLEADAVATLTGEAGTLEMATGEQPGVGVYEVVVEATDQAGNIAASEPRWLVIYNSEGGFVTGGGWIYSDPGAYVPDPTLEGKANFGFVSKYKKEATVPTGNTEFQFRVADLNFHSSSYQWLVITGSNYAKFKGVGAINGHGVYKFQIWAGDGSPDTFRIKIWMEDGEGNETVVYDNVSNRTIGGGSIMVHKAK